MNEISTKEATRKRLNEIESELKSLKSKQRMLSAKWQSEKSAISSIRTCKKELENLKIISENFERDGELAKVAEIRYGKLPEIEKKLQDANQLLQKIQSEGKMLKEEVDAEDIAEVVSKSTGIPVNRMLESELIKLLKMEERIHERVIGQEEAVIAVSNAIRRSRAGLQDINRPIGSFIFIGSTGVGKTELAKALAEFLFDDEQAVIRIDMSEYMEKFSVSRLLGAPPGYVGYEEGGQLTEAVRRKPYSVLLLDEFEKAHADVFNLLLQVLDDGRLTDGKGRLVDFKNTIIIMTSNLGTELIQDKLNLIDEINRDEIMSDIKVLIVEQLHKRLRPEFLNRVDEIVLFKPLTSQEIKKIAELQLKRLGKMLALKNITYEVSESALEWLSNIGFDPQFGARLLKRAIQKHITDPLSVKLLSGEFSSEEKIYIDCLENGKFIFSKK
ncbi:MAG: AAA family ATPase [Candidatus Kapabacteria bacterium]|nr:AAA family ATPase [Candidatus Kapabacteria bacterium]